MFRRAGKASMAAAALAVAGLAIAASASAQLATIELTEQEYYKLRLTAADDEAGLRSLFRAIDDLPREIEDMLLAFQQDLLRSRDAADYLYDRYGAVLDQRGDFAQALADSIVDQTAVLLDGIFRLPLEEQERYLDFVSFTFDAVAESEPDICVVILEGDVTPLDVARIDYIGFAALGPDGFADLLSLYEEALEAEFEYRTPALAFTDNELDEGRAALEAATLALFEDSPLAERLFRTDLEDASGEDICELTSLVFDAFETLGQPERAWALRAVLAEGPY